LSNLYTVFDNSINGYDNEYLELLSIISVVCGILVIVSKNPIVSVLFLICLFLCISGYLIFLGLNFIGLSYLLVYIGAVSILFLFILMLINVRISELQTETKNSLALAIIVGIFLYYLLYILLPSVGSDIDNNELLSNFINLNSNSISYVTSNVWDHNLIDNSHIVAIGNIIYSNYFIWLIITSIILLLAMVGAIIITIKS
jgi:NADH-ubiquinone oxidoreductase chain 6